MIFKVGMIVTAARGSVLLHSLLINDIILALSDIYNFILLVTSFRSCSHETILFVSAII